MANTQNISSLVTGGEASAGPPLGPALGPMGVNIMEVINAINEKTNDFKGMKVPVTVIIDSDTKKWQIEIGIPSASALILKEANIQKGSGTSGTEWVGDIGSDLPQKLIHELYTTTLFKETDQTCCGLQRSELLMRVSSVMH